MNFSAQNPYVNMRLKMQHDGEFRMPPPGINSTRFQVGGKNYEKFGVRCDVEGCWFAEGTLATKADAEAYLAAHKAGTSYSIRPCPAAPRRESLPSGLSYVLKFWAELDDVVEAMMTNAPYRDMDLAGCRGYAKAIAFSIVLLDGVHFPDVESVSRHARDRRKMRLGEIPYVPTPTSNKHNATVIEAHGFHEAEGQPASTQRTPKKAAAPAISEQIVKAIRAGLASQMFTPEDLADTYKIPLDTVLAIKG